MKVYVINLDRSADRLAHMREVLGRVGIAFERIPAADGAALGADLVDEFRRNRVAAKPDGWLTGEVGCFLSHFDAWQKIAARDDTWAAVFEDDIRVSSDLRPLLESPDWIPSDADIVRLEGNRSMRLTGARAIRSTPGRKVYRALSGTSGSAGYIVSKRTAAWLCDTPPALHAAVDVFLFKPRVSSVARSLRGIRWCPQSACRRLFWNAETPV